ncbi:MAG: hypothetical protein K5644_06335 [Lachnospiraceae bacterium]|nr:hypothetical protein [Lachnospiraceae bacterium]
MKQIIDEYGEAIIGVIATVLILGIAFFLFNQGGIIEQFFSQIANNAI